MGRHALTLLELIVVLTILAALSGLLVPLVNGYRKSAYQQATRANLATVRDAVAQYWNDTKLVLLDGGSEDSETVAAENERFQLRWLFRNPIDDSSAMTPTYPEQQIGWNGPYILMPTGEYSIDEDGESGFTATYGTDGDPAVLDSFPVRVGGTMLGGSPIVVQDVNPTLSIRDIRVVSAGPNGVIDTPLTTPTDLLTDSNVGDDIFVALQLR